MEEAEGGSWKALRSEVGRGGEGDPRKTKSRNHHLEPSPPKNAGSGEWGRSPPQSSPLWRDGQCVGVTQAISIPVLILSDCAWACSGTSIPLLGQQQGTRRSFGSDSNCFHRAS